MDIKRKANAYLVLALVLGAVFPVMLKVASQSINIYEFLFLSYLISMPASFAYILFRKKTERLKRSMLNPKEFAFIAFLGLLNYGLLEYGLTYAEKFISSSLATVVYRSFPLFMLIFLPIMLRERVSKYQIIALVLALTGLYIALTGGVISAFSGANAIIIAFVVVIAIASAFVSTAMKRYSFDMEVAMFIFNFATFIFFTALFLANGAHFQALSLGAGVAILYVGLIYNMFVGLMYYGALRMIKTTFVTNIYFLSPFLTFIFAWLILGEQIYLYYIAIAVLVAAGLLIQKLDKRGGTYASRQRRAEQSHVVHDVTSAFVNTEVPLVYNAIKTGGRVLAVKLERSDYNIRVASRTGKGTLIYTNSSKYINDEQNAFINEIMDVRENEFVLMCAGNTDKGEIALLDALESARIEGK